MLVDELWSQVEGGLPGALNAVRSSEEGWVPAAMWLRGLVPFIAGLFVRGPEFADRYERRARGSLGNAYELGNTYEEVIRNPDNTTYSRLMELQRLYAPIMMAEWRVLLFPEPRLVTSDIGYAMTQDGKTGRIGYVFPLDPRTALLLASGPGRPRLFWREQWIAVGFWHLRMDDQMARELARAVAATAVGEFYGPTRESVAEVADASPAERPTAGIGPDYLIPEEFPLQDLDNLWHNGIGIISGPPTVKFLTAEGDSLGAAELLLKEGRVKEAHSLQEEALAELAEGRDVDDPEVLKQSLEIARKRRDLGDLAGARELGEEVMEARIRSLGKQHPDTVEAINSLAITLRNQGELDRAELLHAEALAIARKVLGREHHLTTSAAWGFFLTLYERDEERARALMPTFMWLRERDPSLLPPPQQELRGELLRLFPP
jgi:tetratricopeptide (TPR) repeat protein